MITLIHTTENDGLPDRTIALTTEAESLDSVLIDMEAFLRCVFLIEANERLVLELDIPKERIYDV